MLLLATVLTRSLKTPSSTPRPVPREVALEALVAVVETMRINPYGENPDVALGRVATISVDKAVNFMEETGWDLLDEVSAGLIVGAVVAKLSGMDSEVNLNPTSQQQSMSTRGDGTREGVEFQEVHAHQSPLFAGPDIHFTTLSFQVGIESLLKEGEDWNKVSYRSTDWRNIRRRSSNGQALAAENLITGMLNGGIDDGWIVNIEHVKKDRDSAQSRNRSTGGYHSKTGPHAFFSVTLFVRLPEKGKEVDRSKRIFRALTEGQMFPKALELVNFIEEQKEAGNFMAKE